MRSLLQSVTTRYVNSINCSLTDALDAIQDRNGRNWYEIVFSFILPISDDSMISNGTDDESNRYSYTIDPVKDMVKDKHFCRVRSGEWEHCVLSSAASVTVVIIIIYFFHIWYCDFCSINVISQRLCSRSHSMKADRRYNFVNNLCDNINFGH